MCRGRDSAQLRKESYQSLLDEITALKSWRPFLLTIEIGARGLVASRAYRTFKSLGLTSRDTKQLCKTLSTVAARCSYAIFLAHKEYAWFKPDLISMKVVPMTKEPTPSSESLSAEPSIKVLQRNGIKKLYHFTDAANVESIRQHGLLSASCLLSRSLPTVMNSDELSRGLDRAQGLDGYVRLSFNDKNPMQFKAMQEKRVSKLVMLKISLQVVSRPNVMFSDCNATRTDAVKSLKPDIVRFDVVRAKDQFSVMPSLRQYYQAEVLVPSPIPPHLIEIPAAELMPTPAVTIPANHEAKITSPCAGPIAVEPKEAVPSAEITLQVTVSSTDSARDADVVCRPTISSAPDTSSLLSSSAALTLVLAGLMMPVLPFAEDLKFVPGASRKQDDDTKSGLQAASSQC